MDSDNSKSVVKKNIKQSLNAAFLKMKPRRGEINLFKDEFLKLVSAIDLKESEEFHKNLIKDFLNETHYKNKHYINTKDKSDLVIHNGAQAASSVGVLIETKSPANKNEMPKIDNLNCKAFQELVLYYFRERKTQKNFELRHLIITNVYEWFVFDSHDFEKLFYRNKSFLNLFEQFEEGRLAGTTTDFFYKEIASPEIRKIQHEMPYTYFDIREFKTDCEKNLIAPYKFFSPEHLLKLPFANDSNQLNKEFYAELLHIIGLEEIKQDGKKVIVRKNENERDDGSIIENAIEQIRASGKAARDEYYEHAFDLAITWINRVLFLKLLESQILKYHNNDNDYAFLTPEKLNGYGDLNTLFFSVLAVSESERKENVKNKFSKVPYLNSSLFEQTDTEKNTIFISNLHDFAEISLYSKSVLRGKNAGEKLRPLEYLLRFLDAYDFSGDGGADIQDENKVLISASVLGLIFEKINGYKDGAFFTPSFITMYMCRETIGRAVIQKFNETKGWGCKEINDLHRKIADIDIAEANGIFNSIRICDPSVGSGHFLVSALNEMIYLKSELQILADKNGKTLWNYGVSIENDELIIKNPDGDIWTYNPKNAESQRVQETLFCEKQKIIENCLFGVDINPNSVKICCLRLWIELLKNTYYKNGTSELETLPNIDINIKCGNSLVNRFDLQGNYANLPPVIQQQLTNATKEYKKQVVAYKNTDDKIARRETWDRIEEIKKGFMKIRNFSDPDYNKLEEAKAKLEKLKMPFAEYDDEWKKENDELEKEIKILREKYEEKYKNAFEWSFEFPEVLDDCGDFVGFDVVIGNPPYGIFNKKQNKTIALNTEDAILKQLKAKYPEATGGMINGARIFYAFGFSICCNNGFVSMIVPFGILTDTSSANIRKHIFKKHTLLKADAFPERDNAKKRVFDEVKMSTAIILTSKEKSDVDFDLGISYEKSISEERAIFNIKELLDLNPDLAQIPLANTQDFNLLVKIYKKADCKLGEVSSCLTGEIDMTLGKSALTTDCNNPLLVKGIQLDKFILKTKSDEISQGIIEYVDMEKVKKVVSSKKLADTSQRRIALQGLTGVNEKSRLKATIVEKNLFLANSCNYIIEKGEYKLEYILALFNSKVLNFVFKTLSTSSNVNGYEIDNLSFVKLSAKQQEPFINLVDKILEKKKESPQADTSDLEKEIDNLVYQLYGLNDNEIQINNIHFPFLSII